MCTVKADEIEIKPVSEANAQEVFTLACDTFVKESVLHKVVNTTVEEYRAYLQAPFEDIWKQGLSLAAIDRASNEIVGCLVACDFCIKTDTGNVIPDKLRPINSLLASLEDKYWNNHEPDIGQFLLVDMAAVKASSRGRGIYYQLRKAIHRRGRDAGFRSVVGELSSSATQHLCINKFGHTVQAEIAYESFMYEGENPFSKIKEPPSIILAEGDLK